MNDHSDLTDDELANILSRALSGTEAHESSVPPDLTDGSLWVHQFNNMDAELASAFEADAASLGSRSTSNRVVLFTFDEYDVEVSITATATGRARIDGLVAPPREGSLRGTVGGHPSAAVVSADGSFSVETVLVGTAVWAIQLGDTTLRLEPFRL